MPDVDGFALVSAIASRRPLAEVPVIMLTSAGPASVTRAAAYPRRLTKPVKQSELLDAIVTAFGAPVGARDAAAGKAVRRTRRDAPLRMLVAEDNATNQRLVGRAAEQRGHSVT